MPSVIGGRPDIVAVRDGTGIVIDVKTGASQPFHIIQTMLYMAIVPRTHRACAGMAINGIVRYPDNEVCVPALAVDDAFRQRVREALLVLASPKRPAASPGIANCRWCPIEAGDCQDRMDADEAIDGSDLF